MRRLGGDEVAGEEVLDVAEEAGTQLLEWKGWRVMDDGLHIGDGDYDPSPSEAAQ